MANNVRPFARDRHGSNGPDKSAKMQGRRGRLQHQTTVVHHLFKEYDEAMREERVVCGVIPLLAQADANGWLDETTVDLDAACDEECLAARLRTRNAKERLLTAMRDMNDL